MIDAGGTITHHRALGRDHRTWYDQQRPGLFAEAIKGAKQRLDPRSVMNPGLLSTAEVRAETGVGTSKADARISSAQIWVR